MARGRVRILPYSGGGIVQHRGLELAGQEKARYERLKNETLDWQITSTEFFCPIARVYLCGTITPDPIHLDWRKDAEEFFRIHGIGVLSPVRGKSPSDWHKDGLEGNDDQVYSKGGFVARDLRDIEELADALLLYFPKAACPNRQSIGTWVELGIARSERVPIIVASDMPEVVDHPFVYKLATRVCSTLDEAMEYTRFLLT